MTTVGGTTLATNGAGGPWQSEVAWGTGNTTCPPLDSGGGISPDPIPIPSWQELAGVINSSNGGSTTYRNAPDVAAEANVDNFYCANGCCYDPNSPPGSACHLPLGGTSLAAPTWAGYLALANQQGAASGGAPVGLLSADIYPMALGSGYANDFHDITSGSNGYPAVTGYDLVTGWGSPNGAGLINDIEGPGWQWSFAGDIGQENCNRQDDPWTYSGSQQGVRTSLQWSSSVWGDAGEGKYSWTLSDSLGIFASGTYCGWDYCDPPTGNSGASITATRAPVGTPSVRIAGFYIPYQGCEVKFEGDGTMTPQ